MKKIIFKYLLPFLIVLLILLVWYNNISTFSNHPIKSILIILGVTLFFGIGLKNTFKKINEKYK